MKPRAISATGTQKNNAIENRGNRTHNYVNTGIGNIVFVSTWCNKKKDHLNFSAADHAARSFNESGSRLVCRQCNSRSPKATPLLAAPVWLSTGFLKVPGKSMCIQRHHVTVSGKRPMVSGSILLSKRLFERKLPNDCICKELPKTG